MALHLTLLYVALLLAAVAAISSALPSKLVVNTTAGVVSGTTLQANDGTKILAWLSIPFAEPPIGERRWREAERKGPWKGVLQCSTMRPYCIQAWGGDGASEDCLYLNVYAPEQPSDEGPIPVLFYIYGGALMFGSATDDFTNFIAHSGQGRGVVVVTVNYRLNIFGYLAAQELSAEQGGASGNYGFSDQLMGLEWVRDNIAAFGGDPNRVTIAGQSSGGTSVFALLSSPRSKGLFHRAISLSGSPNITMTLPQAEMQNADIISNSGCRTINGRRAANSEVMNCLRSLSVDRLLELVPDSWWTPGIWNFPKGPSGQSYAGLAIIDGRIVTHSFENALAVGLVDIPLMLGNMHFEPDEYPEQDVSSLTDSQWRAKLIEAYSSWPSDSQESVGEKIYQMYKPYSDENPQKAFDAIVTDYGVYCASIDIAHQAVAPEGKFSNLYLYFNQWNLSTTVYSSSGYPTRYAFHYLDFIMITENWRCLDTYYDEVSLRSGTQRSFRFQRHAPVRGSKKSLNGTVVRFEPKESDLRGAQYIQSLWYDFMSSGNLDSATGGSWKPIGSNPSWPQQYNMFVIDPAGSSPRLQYRNKFCTFLRRLNMTNESFWWVN